MDDGRIKGSTYTPPVTPPPKGAKGKKTDVKEKEGKNDDKVKAADVKSLIPRAPSADSFTSKKKHKVKPLDNSPDFETLYKKIEQSSDAVQINTLYSSAARSRLTDQQKNTLKKLVVRKCSIITAKTYLQNLEKRGDSLEHIAHNCSKNILDRKKALLQTLARPLSSYIDLQMIYEHLSMEIVNYEYSLDQAIKIVANGGPEFDYFLHSNHNFLLFAELLTHRVDNGIPVEDPLNQRIFSQLQYKSACKFAEHLTSAVLVEFGDEAGLTELKEIAGKSEAELKELVIDQCKSAAASTLGFEFDDDKLERYMSMEVLKRELELNYKLHSEDQDASR